MKITAILSSLFLFASAAFAQSSATGYPPYGSFQPGQFDNVNLQNLNFTFTIPMVSTPGRGLSFSAPLVFNSLAWQPISVGSYTYWQPMNNNSVWYGNNSSGYTYWGWMVLPGGGQFHADNSDFTYYPCNTGDQYGDMGSAYDDTETYTNYIYVEPNGTVHSFGPNVGYVVDSGINAGDCSSYWYTWSLSATSGYATDNSGFFMQLNYDSSTGTVAPVVHPAKTGHRS